MWLGRRIQWYGESRHGLLIAGREPETLRLTGWDTGSTAVSSLMHLASQPSNCFYVVGSLYFGKNQASVFALNKRRGCCYCWPNDCRLIEPPPQFESSLSKGRTESLFEEIMFGCRRKLQGGKHQRETFSLQHLLEPETKQLSATHLYSESSQKCHKTQILQRGRQEYFLK